MNAAKPLHFISVIKRQNFGFIWTQKGFKRAEKGFKMP